LLISAARLTCSLFYQTKAMTKWVAAECRRSVLRILEMQFFLGACRNGFSQRRIEVLHMNIDVYRRPVPFVATVSFACGDGRVPDAFSNRQRLVFPARSTAIPGTGFDSIAKPKAFV
jgi:hypothetical protein